jgi:hypothetical protein
MRRLWRLSLLPGLVAFLGVASIAPPAAAQGTNGSARPKVFFDCQGRDCREDYYRTHIPWVSWVRDRQDSDVHVILTSQSTGAAGREYLVDLMGMGAHEGYRDELRYQTPPTATDRERLDGVAYLLGIGLARFASQEGFPEVVRLEPVEVDEMDPTERVVAASEVEDPWDLWVFRLNGNANVSGEETRKNERFEGRVTASRVSPTWKLTFSGNINFNRREIELTDSPDFVDERTDWGFTQLTIYSLAEHWSFGVWGEARRIVSANQDFRAEVTPALEYSFFPYEEATRRSLTAFYKIGPAYRDYIEPTVYGETDELRWEQSLSLSLSQLQPWGEAGIRLRGSHFLHDTGLYNVSLRGNVNVRILRGLSLNANGNLAWVNDQIYLAAEGATTEEELLDLVRRAQNFNYSFRVGFSFQFGSIYNDVVNNRIGWDQFF